MRLKVYTCTDFEGHYPVGAAAVVTAESKFQAEVLLALALKERGLPGDDFELFELPLDDPRARILVDGDY